MPILPFDWSGLLDQIMSERGWDQKTLADRLGLDKSNVTAWLKRGDIPGDEQLRKLRRFKRFDLHAAIVAREHGKMIRRITKRGIDVAKYLQ